MKIKQIIISLQIILSGVVFVYSSLWWTSEMVYSNNQLYNLGLGFPIPFMSFDYIGMDDVTEPIFKLPADIGISHPYQSTKFLSIQFSLNVILVSFTFWIASLYSSRYIETIKLIGSIWFLILIFLLFKFLIIPVVNLVVERKHADDQDIWQPIDIDSRVDSMIIEPTR